MPTGFSFGGFSNPLVNLLPIHAPPHHDPPPIVPPSQGSIVPSSQGSTFFKMALRARGESLRGQAVRWVGDSQSAVTILMVGSMKPRCHAVAVRVWDLEHVYDIRLSCAWMLHTCTEIMVTDDLSKNFDSSEYKLSPEDFEILCQNFGPFCLDLFASPFSHLFKPFCSRLLCKDTAAVDARIHC